MRFRLLCSVGVLCALCGDPLFCAARGADIDKAKLAEIDAAAEGAINRGELPGAVIAVVHADQ
ncbi:MAG: hypothetical protein ACKODX_13705, partial [Gemmata sp.]